MGDEIENPRRAPRAPIRCEARLAVRDGGFLAAETTDYGPGGCQVGTPVQLSPGSRVFLELTHAATPAPFLASGRVAWASAGPSPRAGIAFDASAAATAATLYDHLRDASDGFPAAPARVEARAPLAPALPPASPPALTAEEIVVLTAVGAGVTAGELREKLAARWDTAVNAMFALLGSGVVVLGPPAPDAAAAWKRLLLLR